MNQILLSGRQCIFLYESRTIEINNILSDGKSFTKSDQIVYLFDFSAFFFKKGESSGDLRIKN